MGASVFPMGVTKYDPEKAWSGYTLMPVNGVGAVLIDMNGNVVRTWTDLQGFPNKLLPGGQVMGSLSRRDSAYGYQDMGDVSQVDWDGNVVWSYNKKELLKDGDKEYWMAPASRLPERGESGRLLCSRHGMQDGWRKYPDPLP